MQDVPGYKAQLLVAIESLPRSDHEDGAPLWLLAQVLGRAGVVDSIGPYADDPRQCPNCGTAVTSTKSPYCGERCREIAAFVRQVRAAIQGGLATDSERQLALDQVLRALLGGGYPTRLGQLTERVVARILQRDHMTCKRCGNLATEVDHAKTACNRPINLEAVCASCSRARRSGRDLLRTEKLLVETLADRIGAPGALRACDEAATWDWRMYLADRRTSYTGKIA